MPGDGKAMRRLHLRPSLVADPGEGQALPDWVLFRGHRLSQTGNTEPHSLLRGIVGAILPASYV